MRLLEARSAFLSLSVVLSTAWCGCASHDHPPPPSDGDFASFDASIKVDIPDGPPDPDAPGLCGNVILPAITDVPNLYFILDRSGSMGDPIANNQSKSVAMAVAATRLVQEIGPRANIGAAMFPGPDADAGDVCTKGAEVYSTRPGDQPNATGTSGPVTIGFSRAISLPPYGGTPTAATITALTPTLEALHGRTYVILATDGGPNCNFGASCSASSCIPNIEQAPDCSGAVNCCDPADPSYGPSDCLDTEPTALALAKLFAAGIQTFVIGLPTGTGSSYAAALDAMAVAGGTARTNSPKYYAVNQLGELNTVLARIRGTVILSCDVSLSETPPDPGRVNVYLDSDTVPQDPQNGWIWVSDNQVRLVGAACDELKSGNVQQVQIASGCPTVVPK